MVPRGIIKHIKIYRLFVKFSLMVFFTHRFDFIMSAIANLLWTVFQLIGISVLFTKIPDLKGWQFNDLILLLAFSQIFFYTAYIFYDANLDRLGAKIREGEFDRYLLSPVNIKFYASFEKLSIPQVIATIVTLVPLFVYSLGLRDNLSISKLVLSGIVLIIGLIVLYFFRLTLSGLNFFFEETESLKFTLLNGLGEFSRIPLDILPNLARLLFIYIVPFAFISFYPTTIIVRDTKIPVILLTEVFLLMFFAVISQLVWRKGLQTYSSSSS